MIKEIDWMSGPVGIMKHNDADIITIIKGLPSFMLMGLSESKSLIDRVAKILTSPTPEVAAARESKVPTPLKDINKLKALQKFLHTKLPAIKKGYDWLPILPKEYAEWIPAAVKKQIQEGDLIIYARKDPYLLRWIGNEWIIVAQWD